MLESSEASAGQLARNAVALWRDFYRGFRRVQDAPLAARNADMNLFQTYEGVKAFARHRVEGEWPGEPPSFRYVKVTRPEDGESLPTYSLVQLNGKIKTLPFSRN